jgi:glycosyltransferase involved in cell wall biosynthesis
LRQSAENKGRAPDNSPRSVNGRPKVLIGPFNSLQPGGVAAVHAQFQTGLARSFQFVPHHADRKPGAARQGVMTPLNLLYAVRDFGAWIGHLLRCRPAIAHYAFTSLWNAEKSLLMLSLARAFGARSVAHLHGGAFLNFWGSLGPVRTRLLRSSLNRLDALVVLSDGWREKVVRSLDIAPQRVFVVPNPVDPVFEKAATAMPLDRAGTDILALGALSRQKGSADLLEAMARLPEKLSARLLMVGPEREPGMRNVLLQTIVDRNLRSRAELRAPAVGSDKIDLFRTACIFVLPSYVENLPVVVLEAAASALPIVATPVGALPEYFRDRESIWFVPPGDVEGLAQALERLLGEPALRRSMGVAARSVFHTHFTHKTIMARMERVYQAILAPQERRAVPETVNR